MVPSKNIEILISILFALRGVVGAVDDTSSANAGGGALTTASPGDLATVTIFDTPAYSVAVGCVRECLMQEFEAGVPDGLILAAALGCTSPYYNGCYCTSAVASAATSIISRCIITECSGTAEIPDAFSIYNNYCTTAGYPGPAANIAQTTTAANILQTTTTAQNSGQTAQPSTTLVTGAAVYTVTNGGSTFLITETGVQTLITTPTSSPSSGGGGGSKVNTGAIVGGVLGALLLIVVLLGAFLVWLQRRQKKKAAAVSQLQSGPFVQTQPNAQGAEGSTFVPTAAPVRRGGGRAELPEKGGAGVGEKEVIPDVEEKEKGRLGGGDMVGQREGVEVDSTGLGVGELGGEGRYGLRPEELDSEGRYVGELHGDGRQFGGIELEGREVR
ncbi:hypothetical protein BDZ45DRAFT_751193 [Acephala macrosclerotiorum]|nr:hypothetical protein BDZ45DRAFT_751193 [Acephala macrosclerotiorum]